VRSRWQASGASFDNDPAAWPSLQGFWTAWEIVPSFATKLGQGICAAQALWPSDGLADGCLVALAARDADAVVLTTDTRDFSTYGSVASPEGLFADNEVACQRAGITSWQE